MPNIHNRNNVVCTQTIKNQEKKKLKNNIDCTMYIKLLNQT